MIKWLIGLAIIVLVLGLGVKIVFSFWGEISPVEKYAEGLLSEWTAFTPNAPISYSKTPTLKEIREELNKYDWDSNKMLLIMECESNFDVFSYNPEIRAKEKNLTKFSSCGLLQVGNSECQPPEVGSKLYEWKFNIQEAYKKFELQGYSAWLNCAKKAG